jgi:hypothetical protein
MHCQRSGERPLCRHHWLPCSERIVRRRELNRARKPNATWVDPVFTADVECRDISSEGLLRQSSFKGPTKGTRDN